MSVGPPPPIHHPPPASTWTEPPWSGWIETTGDALLILEAARQGLIPRVTRRLVDAERKMITSGSVFVFDEEESGIKRWTDGFFWSPSRILGNFLLYRETDKRGAGHRSARAEQELNESEAAAAAGSSSFSDGQTLSRAKTDSGVGVDKQRERILVGSLTNSYKFKQDGLMKKTFSVTIGGVSQHLISYYKVADVEAGRLRPPSSLPELASLDISPEYLDKTHFRNPPKVEIGADGVPRYRGEAEDVDGSAPSPPLSASVPLLSEGRVLAMDHGAAAGKRATGRYEPYSSSQPAPKRPRRDTLSDTGLTAISTNTPSSGDSTSSNTPTPTREQSMSVSPQLSSVGTATPQQTTAVPAPAAPVYGIPAGTPPTHPGYAPPQPPYGVPMQYYPVTYPPQWAPPPAPSATAPASAASTTPAPAPAGVGGSGPGGTGGPAPPPHAPTVHGSYPSQTQAPTGSAPAPPGPMPSGGIPQYPQQHQQQGFYPYYPPPPPPGNYSHPRMGPPPPPPSYVHPQMQMHHAPPPPPHMQVPVQMHGVSMGVPGVHGVPPHAQMYPLPSAHAHAPAYSWYAGYAPQPVGVPGPYAYAAPEQQQQQQGAAGGSGAGGVSGGQAGGGTEGGGGAEAQAGGNSGGMGQKAADTGAGGVTG